MAARGVSGVGGHLQRRGYDNLLSTVAGDDQERSLDTEVFDQGLADSLASGRFRIIPVRSIKQILQLGDASAQQPPQL